MMTLDEFTDLAVADVVEVGPLFKGMSPEPLALVTSSVSVDGCLKEFEVTFFGIQVGRYGCEAHDGKLRWFEITPTVL